MSVKNRYPNQDRYINLLTDFGFKRLFGTEPNKELLIDFLNVMLPPKHTVQDVSYRNVEQEAYENSLKYYRDLHNVVATSRQEGVEEGIAQGIEEGRQEGIEKGRQEGIEQRTIEIVRSCLQQGLDIETIMAITQLSREDILGI
ncbi:MAG: hypothetical protein F6J92_20390 [Symploca sp. SIO1A3]|nr:hypothetical protein [Symploca sp. SIO1A3]